MSRVKNIVKIIKNTYYTSIYYRNSIKKKQTGSDILSQIDKAVISKLNSSDLIKSINEGFIELVNNIMIPMHIELSAEQANDFKFTCCAYIDEVMYNTVGEEQWNSFLLEHHYFGTKISGEKMIFKIVKFLEQHSQQDSDYGLVYYYMLCSGYLGMYQNNALKIKSIKKELIKVIEKEILFSSDKDVIYIAPNINSTIIKTKQIDKIRDYRKIYTQAVLSSLCLFIIGIAVVFYKGQIILKMFLC